METPSSQDHLDRIVTQWTLLVQAMKGQGSQAEQNLREQLIRYYRPVSLYLVGITGNPDVAGDLAQEFTVRFLRGDFQGACPSRGRFRDYLRTALRNLVRDHWERQRRRQAREGGPLPPDSVLPEEASAGSAGGLPATPPVAPGWEKAPLSDQESDQFFDDRCRERLLEQVYETLKKEEQETDSPYYTTLSYRTRNPETSSAEMAAILGRQLGRTFTEAGIRKTLQRARERFADLLLDEVGRTLGTDNVDEIEQELAELDLLTYCKSALGRRRGSSS